jgi:hypothetical protein
MGTWVRRRHSYPSSSWQRYNDECERVAIPRRLRFIIDVNGATMARLLVALLITISLGILSRLWPIGYPLYDKSLGDVLYSVAAYLALAIVLFRRQRWVIAVLALCGCVAVETFQATGIPARYEHLVIVRWLIGTEFSWHDITCYVVGVLAISLLDGLWLTRRAVWSAPRSSDCTAT